MSVLQEAQSHFNIIINYFVDFQLTFDDFKDLLPNDKFTKYQETLEKCFPTSTK
mgnify:CR=1 FL=1